MAKSKRKKKRPPTDASGAARLVEGLVTGLFSRDAKTSAYRYLFSALAWFVLGSGAAASVCGRIYLPWSDSPAIARLPYTGDRWQVLPELYAIEFYLFATIAGVFLVLPLLSGTVANLRLSHGSGENQTTLPTSSTVGYWLLWPAFLCVTASCFVPGVGAPIGRASFPQGAVAWDVVTTGQAAPTLWLLGVTLAWYALAIGTIGRYKLLRSGVGEAKAMIPRSLSTVLILQMFVLTNLSVLGMMQLIGLTMPVPFSIPADLFVDATMASGGGQPLVWRHLFNFHVWPAASVFVLAILGIVLDSRHAAK
jgi:heme/copper-type cytochrome/quinol oxidase subunit 1